MTGFQIMPRPASWWARQGVKLGVLILAVGSAVAWAIVFLGGGHG